MKAEGGTSNRMRGSRAPAARARRAGRNPRGRAASATMRSATSRWNISVSDCHKGGHGSRVEPAGQQRGRRHCRAGWRRSAPAASPSSGRGSKRERVGRRSTSSRPGIMRGDLGEGRQAARVALDRDRPRRALGQQRAGQPARSGADLDDRHALERPGGAGDPAVRLRSNRKFWPSDFFGREPMPRDDLAQRRQAVDRAHRRLRPACAASRAGKPQRRDQAVRARDARAGDVEGGAVVGRGAHEGQAERDVDAVVEGDAS